MANSEQAPAAPAAGSNETEITLGLLSAVEENSAVTQRSVAQELGIALGLANAYLKRCVKKGLIKVKQIPPNRYAYYLTPQGFAEKSRLTAEYLSASFTFFRRARAQCEVLFERCQANGWNRIALYGTGDLAEIAVLCAREYDVTLVGIVDNARDGERFVGLKVAANLERLGGAEAVIVTDLKKPQAIVDGLRGILAEERILAPAMLRVSRTAAAAGATAR